MPSKHLSIDLPPYKLKAILENSASQLQLPINIQPPTYVNAVHLPNANRKGFEFYEERQGRQEPGRRIPEIVCPYGKRGDFLYVKEEWSTIGATSQDYLLKATTAAGSPADMDKSQPWQPARTMPKHLARYWLKVTDVSIQRVQELTKEQAIADGPTRMPEKDIKGFAPAYVDHMGNDRFCLGPKTAFKQLFTMAHGSIQCLISFLYFCFD